MKCASSTQKTPQLVFTMLPTHRCVGVLVSTSSYIANESIPLCYAASVLLADVVPGSVTWKIILG
jgi:hypothetical protein